MLSIIPPLPLRIHLYAVCVASIERRQLAELSWVVAYVFATSADCLITNKTTRLLILCSAV